MKRILTLLILIVPILSFAQTDSKYMAGAVPEVDGKVVFTRELAFSNLSKEQIYTALLDWGNKMSENGNSTVAFTDIEKGLIAIQAKDIIRVKIGLFPTNVNMHYLLTIKCEESKCILTVSRIKYTNNPSSQNPTDILLAEEYITDKYALNKAKTKIHHGLGDYRMKTIDVVDNLAAEAQKAVDGYYAQQPSTTAPVQQQPVQVQKAEQPATIVVGEANKAEMKDITANEIPADVIKAVSENGLYITAVDGRPLSKAIWGKGGLDITSSKSAAVFSVTENTDNILYLLEKAETYTLAFVAKNADNVASLVIECRKSQQFDKLFVGEIVEVKTR